MYYRCKCFLTNNYFLDAYKTHVTYANREQLWREFGTRLAALGCDSDAKRQRVLEQIDRELARRQRLDSESAERMRHIADNYRPKHPHVYRLTDDQLDPSFVRLAHLCSSGATLADALPQVSTVNASRRLYQFPVFSPQFCADFMDEIDNFNESAMPKARPNTMNNYGVLLSDLGFDTEFVTPLRERYLNPMARVFFADWSGDSGLDSHRAFTVRYRPDEDRDLFTHFDNAEVTLNVCLGKRFAGSELHFGELRTVRNNADTVRVPVDHVIGSGVFHASQLMHGSVPIVEGERNNLVIWMRSSSVRNRLCPMCDRKPELIESYGFGDGFTRV